MPGTWVDTIDGTNDDVGPQVVTQNFGNPGDSTSITGVVFEDVDGDEFYDVGEGRVGVRVDVDGSPFYAVSSTSGAYSVPVSGDGDYPVTFSHGGFATYQTITAVTGGMNAKVDYLAGQAGLLCDFTGDGNCDLVDLSPPSGLYGVGNLTQTIGTTSENSWFDLSGDGVIDTQDLDQWLLLAADSAGFSTGYLPGDTDLDGIVGFPDFLRLADNYGAGDLWEHGNFNGDGEVNFVDFILLSGNYNKSLTANAASVPEPSMLSLAGISLLAMVGTHRRARRQFWFPCSA